MVLKSNVTAFAFAKLLPIGKLAFGYPLFPFFAANLSINNVLAIEPMLNLVPIDHNL